MNSSSLELAKPFLKDVLCCITVSVYVLLTAIWTIPLADTNVLNLFILVSAIVAELTGRKPLVYLDNGSSTPRGNIFQDCQKRGNTIISDLLAVSFLHPSHIQRF